MDSITHTLVGVGIGATATTALNLGVSEELVITGAAILASNIQDLDVVSKLFGNISFINNHRGESHMIRWTPLIALIISLLFSWIFNVDVGVIYVVSFISLLIHIGLDALNSYGTKITDGDLVRVGAIHTYDIVLMITLVISTTVKVVWNYNLFIPSFLLIGIYLLIRLFSQFIIKSKLINKYKPNKTYLMAKGDSVSWNIILEFDNHYLVFDYVLGFEFNKDCVKKEKIDLDVIRTYESNEVVKAFKSLSPVYIIKKITKTDGVIIKYIDLRYRHKGNYYFNAIYKLNNKNEFVDSSIGWNLKHAEQL